MSWENILKEGFEDIDSFIEIMKQLNINAMNEFKQFNTKTRSEFKSIELQDLATAIIDMGESIMALEKMRNMQEELQ
tara:strand:- start:140 stop:370 length:231 start_codon:yes stop_codon:yes gene_type:complete